MKSTQHKRSGWVGVAVLVATAAAHGQCDQWVRVSTPDYGATRNVVLDADASSGGVWLLSRGADGSGNSNVQFHLLRWSGGGWEDLGIADPSSLPNPPVWSAVTVAPNGDVWIGGMATDGFHPAVPTVAKWTESAGWGEPQMIDLMNEVEYPYNERGGSILAMDVSSDGTVAAVGVSGGFGGAGSNDGSRPLLLVNTTGAWQEIDDPNYDWPGDRDNKSMYDVVAFDSDNIMGVGRHGSGGTGPGALVAHFDGSTWTRESTPADGGQPDAMEAYAIEANGPDDIWIVGEGSVLADTALFMHFDGSQWTIYPSPYPGVVWLDSLAMNESGELWAHPALDESRAAFFDGVQWSLASPLMDTPPEDQPDVERMLADQSGGFWAVGTLWQGNYSTSQSLVLTTGCDACPADFNDDGTVNTQDILAFLNAWSSGDPRGDFNGDGSVNTIDVLAFLNAWSAGC